MENKEEYADKLERAKKRVKELKGFYDHLKGYIIANLILFLAAKAILKFLADEGHIVAANALEWMNLNMILTPGLWGIGLLIHGIIVFRYKFTPLKKWEDRQIQKYLEKENRNSDKYN